MPDTPEGAPADPDVGERTKLSTILGHPFSFAYHTRYARVAEGGSLLPGNMIPFVPGWRRPRFRSGGVDVTTRANDGTIENGKVKTGFPATRPKLVTDRWIYVFSFSQKDGFRPSWLAELFVDENGNVHVNPVHEAHRKNKWAKPTSQMAPASEERMNELARRINGRSRDYWFLGSRHRLTDKAIRRFEDMRTLYSRVFKVDFTDEDDLVVLKDGTRAIPVDCPVDVAIQLGKDFEQKRYQHMQMLGGRLKGKRGPTDGQINDLMEYHVANFVKNCAENKDDLKALKDIGDFLADDGLERAEKAVNAFEALAQSHLMIADTTAADLAYWMDRFMFRFVIEGVEEIDEGIMLADYDKCLAGIVGSPAGIAYLNATEARVLMDQGNVIRKHIVEPEPGIAIQFKNRKTVTKAVVGLVAVFAKAGIADFTRQANSVLQTASNRLKIAYSLADAPLEEVSKTIEYLVYETPKGNRSATVKRAFVRLEEINTRTSTWRKLKVATNLSETALHGLLDGISLAIAVRAYFETPDGHKAMKQGKKAEAILAATQTAVGLGNAAMAALGETAATLPWRTFLRNAGLALTFVTFAMDVGKSVDLAMTQDYDASILLLTSASIILGVGVFSAALSALGAFACADAVLVFGFIGLILLLIAFLFYIAYLVAIDTELKSFIGHSAYGKYAGESKDKPAWAPAPMKFLAGSWEDQLGAITALAKGFLVEVRSMSKVYEIDGKSYTLPAPTAHLEMGLMDEHTEFLIIWSWKTSNVFDHDKQFERQHWTALSQKGRDTRIYSEGGRSYMNLSPPMQAARDSRDSGGKFIELMLEIRKIIRSPAGDTKLPHTNYLSVMLVDEGKTKEGQSPTLSVMFP